MLGRLNLKFKLWLRMSSNLKFSLCSQVWLKMSCLIWEYDLSSKIGLSSQAWTWSLWLSIPGQDSPLAPVRWKLNKIIFFTRCRRDAWRHSERSWTLGSVEIQSKHSSSSQTLVLQEKILAGKERHWETCFWPSRFVVIYFTDSCGLCFWFSLVRLRLKILLCKH